MKGKIKLLYDYKWWVQPVHYTRYLCEQNCSITFPCEINHQKTTWWNGIYQTWLEPHPDPLYWVVQPILQLLCVLVANHSQLHLSPENCSSPERTSSSRDAWEVVSHLPSANPVTDWCGEQSSLPQGETNSVMQDTFQSSPWDPCEARLQLNLWFCLAFTPGLSGYPSPLQASPESTAQ